MKRLAVIAGLRTPMTKTGTALKNAQVDDLAGHVFREVMYKSGIDWKNVDEVILGNVAQPAHAANVARVAALKAGLPIETPAYTVHRNCASGMQSITEAVDKIRSGYGSIFLVGGAESMSNIPLLFNSKYTAFMEHLMRAKTGLKKLKTLLQFRLHMLKPDIGLIQGLTDPVSGLIMGLTAENLAREFHISREEQDEFALRSHRLAAEAQAKGIFDDEIVPTPTFPNYKDIVTQDIGPRANQTIEALAKLKPYFDRRNGTVTVGNSSQITDGAAALLIMSESEAKKRAIEPLGYIKEYAYASLDPHRMGLGPVYATARLMDRTGFHMRDIKYIEINEAFAAQVVACERAFDSDVFAKTFLDRSRKLGAIDRDILNMHGGAIALGHPVGMTGTRIVLHTLKELRRRKKNTGLASLCVGGGQGAAFLLEVA